MKSTHVGKRLPEWECQECGREFFGVLKRCPACGSWNSKPLIKEEEE